MLAVTLAVQVAAGAPTPTPVLVWTEAESPAATAITEAAQAAGFAVRGAEALPPTTAPATTADRERRATEATAAAEAALLDFELEDAADAYQQARDLLRAAATEGALSDFHALAEAHLTLGVTLASLDRHDDANAEYRAALAIDRELQVDPARYPPNVVAAFELERDRILSTPTESLAIATTPAGADIQRNGRAAGRTPRTLTELVPGQHYIQLVAAGYAPLAFGVDIPSGDIRREELPLEVRPAELIRTTCDDPDDADRARLAAQSTASRFVICVDGTTATVIDGSDGSVARWPSDDDGLADAIVAHLRQRAGGTHETETAWYGHWWVWAIAGGVVAAGGVVTYVALRPDPVPVRVHP